VTLRGGEVHAVHVREAKCHSLASYAMPAQSGPVQSQLDGSIDFSIDEMVRSVQPDLAPGTQVHTEVVDGLAARVLLERCAGADMLVLGTASDESGAPRSAGPVIRACLRRAPCAVVVISVAQHPSRYREPALAAAGVAAGAGTPAGVPAVAGV
jgi:nucleotide-binding universal stress UspA family protein